jgi:hypothetical protein
MWKLELFLNFSSVNRISKLTQVVVKIKTESIFSGKSTKLMGVLFIVQSQDIQVWTIENINYRDSLQH